MENKKETVSNVINIPEDLHKKLKIDAITKNKSLHEIMVECVEKGFEIISGKEPVNSENISTPVN